MEVAKCSPDLTVQSSVRDPEVTGEAVNESYVTAWPSDLNTMPICRYKEVA